MSKTKTILAALLVTAILTVNWLDLYDYCLYLDHHSEVELPPTTRP